MIKKIKIAILTLSSAVLFSISNSGETGIAFGSSDSYEYNDSQQVFAYKQKYLKNNLSFSAVNETNIKNFALSFSTMKAQAGRPIFNFYSGDFYSTLKGVTCFRGNNMRDGGSFGAVDVKEEKLKIIWEKGIGGIDSWTGVGWNGQPAIVQWDSSMLANMNISSVKKQKQDLKEVIYATLDGNVYFLDLDDGKETRSKLNIGAPVKGSLTVDPRGLPLLYVGQGINKNGSTNVEFAYRIFSLTNFKKLYEIKGSDSFSRRDWGAFDSTALIDSGTDSMFLCGENGVFYSGKLNTKYENGEISIAPSLDRYRYDSPGKNKKGIENSIAIYKKYGFFADNDGLLQCLDLTTLIPVWMLDVKDDTDSTIVLEKTSEGLDLYTANEVDIQGNGAFCYTRKIDGTSGRILWENKYKCSYDVNVNGGALATPVLGKEDISDLIIFNIARTPEYQQGILVALDKTSGKEIWKLPLKNYCWSSPVALYTDAGKSYIVQCDSTGKAMLIEGRTGKLLHSIELGSNVEGTPAAFENKLVVGTRGCKIVGFEVQ